MLPIQYEKSMRWRLSALVALILCIPFSISAATIAELQVRLQALMTQIAVLQASSTTSASPQSGAAPSASCPNLTRNLFRGMKGSDVSELQQFLISQKLLAPDSASGFFGAMTEAAVKQWQAKNGLASSGTPATTGYGAVGPKTRGVLASCSKKLPNQTSATPMGTYIVPPEYKTSGVTISPSAGGGSAVVPTVTMVSAVVAPVTYTWQTGGWSACANTSQARTVSCLSSNNTIMLDSFCTATKPPAIQSCIVTSTPTNESCTINNQTVAHGASVTAYQSASVPYGSQCVSQQRTCTNGVVSGTFTAASCSVLPGAPASIPNILVGFWGSALLNDYAGNHILAASAHANVAVFDQSAGSYVSRVEQASAAGVKSVLMSTWILFSDGRTLLPDYRERFDAAWNALGARQSDVVGFYLTDEPYYNNKAAGSNGITETQLRANLAAAAEYIHQKAPGRPVMLTEGYPIIDTSTNLSTLYPESIDFVGVNCYLAFGQVCSESKVTSLVAKLAGSLKGNQKLMATMDGYWPTTPSVQNDMDLRARIIFWENLLAPYFISGRVGAITPFIYQNVPNDPNGVHGVVESPQAFTELNRYLDSVRSGNPQPLSVINLAAGKFVLASNTLTGSAVGNVVDGNNGTVWISGGYSPQWVQIDLSAPRTIKRIRLTIEQSPEGQTSHSIYSSESGTDGSWQLIKTFQSSTAALQVIEHTLPLDKKNVRFVRVETTVSPSWVAWREIEIEGY